MALDLRDVGSALIYLGYIAAALAAIGVVVRWVVLRWVVKPLKAWLREQIKPPLDAVQAEMTPDHGRSLRDVVNRIENRVSSIETRQAAQNERFRDHILNHPGAS